ncbi:hypothetical protein K9M48_01835 [Candidatus Gracilibacteria bacterium]|nr:hypothetical protein [Candidatus Gracilibacteria bacterium]
MPVSELIKQKLPEDLWELASTFVIPENYLNNDSELIALVLKSKSIDKPEEKQSWFNLLAIMNKEQVDRLRDILIREKNKLEEIENKYEQKKEEIKQKYESRFKANDYERTMDKLQETENIHKEKDSEDADNLLSQI